ncbi:MAG TPA: hypothetical protein V6D19_03300 [Stenomitos sp.]
MNRYLNQDEKLPEEEFINAIPYKPFSILIVTDRRIIGKRLLPLGPKRFEGAIFYDKIVRVKYLPGISLVTVPSIVLEHQLNDGRVEKITIHFPGFTGRFAGFKPEDVYHQIAKRLDTKRPAI